jgi:serine/threonine-protein kinase RsbW
MPIVDEQTAKPMRESGSGDGRTVRLTIPAKAEYITLGRLALTGLARLRPLSDEVLADLKLALTEATSNSVRHAYPGADGLVEISYELQGDRLAIMVTDEGRGFDAADEAEVDDLENLTEGGLGIAIIRAIADEFELGKGPGGKGSQLRFVKNLTN